MTGLVTEAVKQYVESQKKQWKHDRAQTIGASEIGQCARKIFCLKFEDDHKLGVDRNPDFIDGWGARERGNLIEKHLLVPAMRKRYGNKALFLGDEQRTFFDGMLSATPDCILEIGDPNVLVGNRSLIEYVPVEFKSIDPRASLGEAKYEHIYQVQDLMGILNHLGEYPCHRAIISYTDASFLNETKEFEIKYDPAFYEAAKLRAGKILNAGSMADVLPEGWIAGGRECEYCPFSLACGRQRKDIPDESAAIADPQFIAEIADLARQYKLAQSMVESSEKDVRNLQTDIKSRLQEKKLRRVVGHGVSVSWSPIKGREITDVKALREAALLAGIDIEPFISQGESGDRLTVTVKN